MKNILYTIAFVAVTALFMGCPYSTKINMEENPSEKVDPKFLGSYEKKGSTTYTFKVSKLSSNTYQIEEVKNSDGTTAYTYEAYTVTIKGTQFLITTRPAATYDKKYYIYKMESNSMGTIFSLYSLTENITEEFENASQLRDYIAKYKDVSFFYEKTVDKYYKTE